MSLAELLPRVTELSRSDKLQLIQLVAADLAGQETSSMFESGEAIDVWLPVEAPEAAEFLRKWMESKRDDRA